MFPADINRINRRFHLPHTEQLLSFGNACCQVHLTHVEPRGRDSLVIPAMLSVTGGPVDSHVPVGVDLAVKYIYNETATTQSSLDRCLKVVNELDIMEYLRSRGAPFPLAIVVTFGFISVDASNLLWALPANEDSDVAGGVQQEGQNTCAALVSELSWPIVGQIPDRLVWEEACRNLRSAVKFIHTHHVTHGYINRDNVGLKSLPNQEHQILALRGFSNATKHTSAVAEKPCSAEQSRMEESIAKDLRDLEQLLAELAPPNANPPAGDGTAQ